MTIKISYNWLLDYLDKKATASDLQKYLSLCGPSIEHITRIGSDYILDTEITSNRVDMASHIGVAREAAAILPRFGLEAKFKPLELLKINIPNNPIPLKIISDKSLCRRIMAVVIDKVSVRQSEQQIKNRLESVGVRSLNNIIDITNYIMLETGQPTHVFDYDKIQTHIIKIRLAKKNETITTLDNKTHKLNSDDIVIDDGNGLIIDLPGIMGAKNSAVTKDTTKIIFFIDSIDPLSIRKTSMRLGIRTLAATINEKNPSPDLVKLAFNRGVQLFQKQNKYHLLSRPFDDYPVEQPIKKISINVDQISTKIGLSLSAQEISRILESLDFETVSSNPKILQVKVPYFRYSDIDSQDDIIEEIARIYGYFRIPSIIQRTEIVYQPKAEEKIFNEELKIKYLLKYLGCHETFNYSLVSKQLLKSMDLKADRHLRLSNTISSDIEYLRTSLIPSLVKNCKDNEGKKDDLRLFEIAKTYHYKVGQLPDEKRYLTLATNTNYYDLKGILETVFDQLKIKDIIFVKGHENSLLSANYQVSIQSKKQTIGCLGQLNEKYRVNVKLKKPIFCAEFDLEHIVQLAKPISAFIPMSSHATVKLDLTFIIPKKMGYDDYIQQIEKTSSLITNIEFISHYQNKITIRISFTNPLKNITENEAMTELTRIRGVMDLPSV